MTRRAITNNQRARIFLDAEGICHICGLPIHAARGDRWDVEHRKPLWLGGEDTMENMAPAHIHCHRGKTAEEAPERAKSNRVRNKNLGIRNRAGLFKSGSIRTWRSR